MARTWYTVERSKMRLRKNFTLVMLDMMRLSRETGICPERDVVKYIRSAVAIDGLITRVAPQFDLGTHLAAACDRHLQRELKEALFGYDAVLDWASTCLDLINTGGRKTEELLKQIARCELLVQIDRPPESLDHENTRRKALYLSSLFVVLLMIIAITGQPPRLGMNVFTIDMAVLTGAAVLLLRTKTCRRSLRY
jgi:hypothetical protein